MTRPPGPLPRPYSWMRKRRNFWGYSTIALAVLAIGVLIFVGQIWFLVVGGLSLMASSRFQYWMGRMDEYIYDHDIVPMSAERAAREIKK